jgi:hypothetical protein
VSTNKLSVQDLLLLAAEPRCRCAGLHALAQHVVNILRQIDTRVIPCNSLAAVSPALNRLTITLRPRCGVSSSHTQFTSFERLTSADPPALMSSL